MLATFTMCTYRNQATTVAARELLVVMKMGSRERVGGLGGEIHLHLWGEGRTTVKIQISWASHLKIGIVMMPEGTTSGGDRPTILGTNWRNLSSNMHTLSITIGWNSWSLMCSWIVMLSGRSRRNLTKFLGWERQGNSWANISIRVILVEPKISSTTWSMILRYYSLGIMLLLDLAEVELMVVFIKVFLKVKS